MPRVLALVPWIAAAFAVASAPVAVAQTCQPTWIPSFASAGAFDNDVATLATFDDGSGTALYAGGAFTAAGTTPLQHVAKWTGANWAPLGAGLTISVGALAVFDDGSGPQLYAGGSFFVSAPSNYQGEIHRWNGTSWTFVASTGPRSVSSFAIYDAGTGPQLYGAGAWLMSPLPTGFMVRIAPGGLSPILGLANLPISGLLGFDDGTGSRLFAAGSFSTIDGISVLRIASWDGATWAPVGGGFASSMNALAVADFGSGPRLFAGGSTLSEWTGSSWITRGTPSGLIQSLAVFDDGSGPALYAGGSFSSMSSVPASGIARFDGAGWSALGNGVSAPALLKVNALRVFDDGACSGPSLIAGGNFTSAGTSGDAKVARWRCPAGVPSPGCSGAFCFGDGLDTSHTTACPCGNVGAGGHGCAHSFSAAGAELALAGTPNPDTLVLVTSNTPATSFALYMQHDAAGDQPFHDGVLCASGNLIRLRGRVSVNGAITFPDSTDTVTLSARGMVTPGSGAVRYYAAWYRNASTSFCPPATANVTNGAVVYW